MGTGLVVIEKAVEFLAEEVVSGLIQNKVLSNSLDKKVENALASALNQVAKGNDFWKTSVQIQRNEVLSILVQVLSDPNELDVLNNPNYSLPKYLDPETIKRFNEQLGKDIDTYLYLKVLVHDYILKSLKYASIHFLTKIPPKPTVVIGRDDDLQSLWTALNHNNRVMLTGFGGIGKTKLAQLLFHKYECEFDEVAWIGYKGNLKQSFLDCITAQQFSKSNYQNENERWDAITSILSNNGKKKLFVIDNVDNDFDQHPEQDEGLRFLTGWIETTVLLTSRLEDLNGFDKFELNNLKEEDCKKLFNHYYGKVVPNQELVGEIVELANWHTLTIELLAKGARRENLDDFYNKVKSGFEGVDREITTEHHDGRTNIESHLKKLFDLQKRTDEDKKVLNGFAILPANCECTMEEIEQWFGFKNADLDGVIQDGWLSYDEDREIYYMHPLVRTIVRFDFIIDEEGKKVIAPIGTTDRIMECLSHYSFYSINNVYRQIDIAENVINAVVQTGTEIYASVCNHLGYCCNYVGEYDKALVYYEKELTIKETKLGKNHLDVAEIYNRITEVFLTKCDYDSALKYNEKAQTIWKTKYGKKHSLMAVSYNNMGEVYNCKGDYDKALECFEKALEIIESCEDKYHHISAIYAYYNNIASVYRGKNSNDKALEYYNKAMSIMRFNLEEDDDDFAMVYNNIGEVYCSMGDYCKALEYYKKALLIRESKLGKNHFKTALVYNNIGANYQYLGSYDKALEYCVNALLIFEHSVGIEHQRTAVSYCNVGGVLWEKGDKSMALECDLRALKILLQTDRNHPITMKVFANLKLFYEKSNQEMPFDEWLKDSLNEREWEVFLKLLEDFLYNPTKYNTSYL